jgi:parallel beta-helix repeat protein
MNGIRGEEPNNNDWVIETDDNVSRSSDEGDIHLDGNLYVEGNLDLSDITLTLDCTSDGEFQIYVDQQGSLRIDNCMITTSSSQNRFKFRVYGSMTISSSTISNLWGDADNHIGGIQIYNSNVNIQDCTFSDLEVGVYINRAYPTIENNNFEDCGCAIISDSASSSLPPDFYLDPSKIAFSDDTPIIGDEIQISSDIENIGDCQALATVRFYDGNPVYGYTNPGFNGFWALCRV